MRNRFTVKVQCCHIGPDLTSETVAGTLAYIKHLLEKSEADTVGKKNRVLILFEAPQVYGRSRQTPCYNCDEAAVLCRTDLDYQSSLEL